MGSLYLDGMYTELPAKKPKKARRENMFRFTMRDGIEMLDVGEYLQKLIEACKKGLRRSIGICWASRQLYA